MKKRSPFNRDDLRIKKKDRVLEVGSGHNPLFRSDVIVEKYVESNEHRSGEVKVYAHQRFVNADGEKLPFKDKEFDYVICNQVLEHAADPVAFIQEQCRVAKRGYIETPSLLGEYLFPKESHKWVILDIDNKLVLFEKSKMPGNYKNNYGELLLNYLPYQSLVYKLLWLTEGDLMMNRYEWEGSIEYVVNPTDAYYLSFFTQSWTREMAEKLYPRRGLTTELFKVIKASVFLLKSTFRSKLNRKEPLDLPEYLKLANKPGDI